MIIVGVDAGGTKTIAGAYTCEGEKIGEGLAGPGNYHNVGIEKAIGNVRTAVMASTGGKIPDFLGIGMAGLDTKKDFDLVRPLVKTLAKNVIIEHDGFADLFGETGGKAGVLTIAGTGSVVVGLDNQGNKFRISDWGWLLGDEGSAYYIGREALRETAAMLDGRKSRSILADYVLEKTGAGDIEELVSWAYTGPPSIDEIASLSAAVDRAANEGDEDAIGILNQAASSLASSAVNLAKRLQVREIFVKGGVFSSTVYMRFFSSYVEARGISIRRTSKVMYKGGLIMASMKAGCNISLE
ncbi:ATPase [Sulfolobales archaeon HS-7]|nr:ATPase [Sulfolobales archaeon HS-7]